MNLLFHPLQQNDNISDDRLRCDSDMMLVTFVLMVNIQSNVFDIIITQKQQ